jgi:uncharacterized protein (TIGR02646 family)
MRRIVKTSEPKSLSEFKIKYKRRNKRQPAYKEVDVGVKSALHSVLMREQFYICAYCMVSINDEHAHIEHIKPQSKFPNQTLDYDNLLVSCDSKENCGNEKGDWWDSSLFISPLEPDCETEFTYTPDGRIVSNSSRGMKTIEVLNLNSHRLLNGRKQAIAASGFFDEDFEANGCGNLSVFTQPNEEGKLAPFCKAIEWLFENWLNG